MSTRSSDDSRRRQREAEIAERIEEGGRIADRARQDLFDEHQALVEAIAKEQKRPGVHFLDLIQEGNIALMQATNAFVYDPDSPFSVRAASHIRQGIREAVEGSATAEAHGEALSPKQAGALNEVLRTIEHLGKRGRAPTPEEIARAMGASPDAFRTLTKALADPSARAAAIDALTKDPATTWASAPKALQSAILDRCAVYRRLGFLSEHDALSDEDLAATLYADIAPLDEWNDWSLLVSDRRMWSVDFTGSSNGADIDLLTAVKELARISSGKFQPEAVDISRIGGSISVSFTHEAQSIRISGLVDSPLQFDLSLVERLNRAVEGVSFFVVDGTALDDDLHHFLVLSDEELEALGTRHLPHLQEKDFAEFRAWAMGETAPR